MGRLRLVTLGLLLAAAFGGPMLPRGMLRAQQTAAQPAAARGPVVSVSLESTAGGRSSLASMLGKVVVIFYEDRDHRDDNLNLKGVLVRFAQGNAIRRELVIVPVANVSGFDFPPASTFARAAIRSVAREIRLPILFDWRGALQAAPFSLADGASNVMVIDRAGHVVFRHTGAVTNVARTEFFRAVRRAIRDRDGDGVPDATAASAPPAPTAR